MGEQLLLLFLLWSLFKHGTILKKGHKKVVFSTNMQDVISKLID